MDLKYQRNTLKLVRSIMDRKNSTTPVIPSVPQKVKIFDNCADPFPDVARSAVCDRYFDAVSENGLVFPHSAVILKNGQCIGKHAFSPYKLDVPHATFSLAKSVTGLAVGIAVGEGLIDLDEPISDIFKGRVSALPALRPKPITVRHLLTMTSGIVFSEAGSVTDSDWVKTFLESASSFEAGTQFAYNSMNSYMLSAIICELTGTSLCEYLEPRLFAPLGITDYYWEKCPSGIEKGGFGLYMTTSDTAKLGQLYLNLGLWNGEQLVPLDYMQDAVSVRVTVSRDIARYDYGYHVWVGKSPRLCAMNGLFGQNCLVFFDTDTVVAMNAENSDMFHKNPFFEITENVFGRESGPLFPSPSASFPRLPLPHVFGATLMEALKAVNGLTWDFDRTDASSVGLLPLFTQVLQNNYTKGITSMSFRLDDSGFTASFEEDGKTYNLPVGFTAARYARLNFRGERYRAAVQGSFFDNGDGVPILKITVSFLEIPNSRIIKCAFSHDGSVSVTFSENPGIDFLKNGVAMIGDIIKPKRINTLIVEGSESEFTTYLLNRVISPVLKGVPSR